MKLFLWENERNTGIRPVKPTNRLDSATRKDSRATYFQEIVQFIQEYF